MFTTDSVVQLEELFFPFTLSVWYAPWPENRFIKKKRKKEKKRNGRLERSQWKIAHKHIPKHAHKFC